MSWKRGEAGRVIGDKVSIALRPKEGKLRACFAIGSAVCRRLSLAPGLSLSVSWGLGGDYGLVRMETGEGYRLRAPSRRHRALYFATTAIPRNVVFEPHPAEWCSVKFLKDRNGIDVSLPGWFYRPFVGFEDEENIVEDDSPVPLPRDRTALLMGDPVAR